MSVSLPVVNAATATFECTFGRGCDGKCCSNGRPSVGPTEMAAIRAVLPRALPLMRPEARKAVADDFVSRRTKLDQPMLKVAAGWCVFFHKGCVLHTLGAEDGEAYQYKPTQCALFPLEPNGDGTWYVRQHGYNGEKWDLFCLSPKNSTVPAVESLAPEIELAARLEAARPAEPGAA
jgi:Fe-S-cluster containining protein